MSICTDAKNKLVLITGGSCSGKSAYAENLCDKIGKEIKRGSISEERKYYLATMYVTDDEMREKVARHRERRAGKGWITIEKPVDIADAGQELIYKLCKDEPTELEYTHAQDKVKSVRVSCEEEGLSGTISTIVLLECMSNLAANEMFRGGKIFDEKHVENKVLQDIKELRKNIDYLVVVTNNVFEDGKTYDDATMSYLRALGRINGRLAMDANEVTEVVAGIPVKIK